MPLPTGEVHHPAGPQGAPVSPRELHHPPVRGQGQAPRAGQGVLEWAVGPRAAPWVAGKDEPYKDHWVLGCTSQGWTSVTAPLCSAGRDLKVSNLLMTDKGCVKTGELPWLLPVAPLAGCGHGQLCSALSVTQEPACARPHACPLPGSGFRAGSCLRSAAEANDPQGRHPLVSILCSAWSRGHVPLCLAGESGAVPTAVAP